MRKKSISLMLIFATIILFPVSANAVSDNELRFKNGKFTVMQISDMQDLFLPAKALNQTVEAAIEKVKPDLIVLTGDNIIGYTGGITKYGKYFFAKKAITAATKPIVKSGIPFAVVFGNHDCQCGVSKEEQMKIYQSFDNCVAVDEGDMLPGCGTYNLPIKASNSDEIIFNIWLADSRDETEVESGYGYVSSEQIEWYKNKSDEINVNSIWFQHVPVPEVMSFVKIVDKGTEGAVEKGDKYYILDSEKATGILGERPCPAKINEGLFDAWVEKGNVIAAFFGHDHSNNYIGNIKGIDLVATPGCAYNHWGDKSRGVRVIQINENNTSTYSTYTLDYFDLFGRTSKTYMDYAMSAMELIPLRIIIYPLIVIYNLLGGLL